MDRSRSRGRSLRTLGKPRRSSAGPSRRIELTSRATIRFYTGEAEWLDALSCRDRLIIDRPPSV